MLIALETSFQRHEGGSNVELICLTLRHNRSDYSWAQNTGLSHLKLKQLQRLHVYIGCSWDGSYIIWPSQVSTMEKICTSSAQTHIPCILACGLQVYSWKRVESSVLIVNTVWCWILGSAYCPFTSPPPQPESTICIPFVSGIICESVKTFCSAHKEHYRVGRLARLYIALLFPLTDFHLHCYKLDLWKLPPSPAMMILWIGNNLHTHVSFTLHTPV